MVTPSRRPIKLSALEYSAEECAEFAAEVVKLCAELDVDVSEDEALICVKHLLYVNQLNQFMNLTRITDLHEALVLHIVDSFSLARILPADTERMLDIGTGAGFPGVPLAVLTGAEAVLLDSVGKKIDAVNLIVRELGIENVTAIHDRCEAYALQTSDSFDLVVARAVGQMGLLIEYATPFLEDGGYFIVAKGSPSADEVKSAHKTAEICGLELIATDEFDLPDALGHRTVFLYQKEQPSRVKLPRAVGLAKKMPLA